MQVCQKLERKLPNIRAWKLPQSSEQAPNKPSPGFHEDDYADYGDDDDGYDDDDEDSVK